MIIPRYTPPLIDFNVKHEGVKAANKPITVVLEVESRGEIAVTFQDVNATLYDSNRVKIAPVKLKKPLHIEPHEVDRFNITSDVKSLVVKLIPYFKASNEVTLSAKGVVLVKVFGTKASASFTITQGEITIETAIPIQASFTAQFWFALTASVLASTAKIIPRRKTC